MGEFPSKNEPLLLFCKKKEMTTIREESEVEGGGEATLAESSQKVKEAVESIDATLASTEINMASIRETIEAIDSFQARWNVRQCLQLAS